MTSDLPDGVPSSPATAPADEPAIDPGPWAAGPQGGLARAVVDLERHVAAGGWDGPVGVYALVRTADALSANPALATDLPEEALAAAAQDPDHLLSIEQDGLPDAPDLESLLAQLAWPDSVDGVAVAVERIVVPPDVEARLPQDPAAQVAALLEHPAREDVRIVAGVLRTGESWCALRSRSNDSEDAVGGAPDAVPGLVEALRATLV